MVRDAWKCRKWTNFKLLAVVCRKNCKPCHFIMHLSGVSVSSSSKNYATKMQKTTLKTYHKKSSFILLTLTFGIKRCKLLCLMKNFFQSLKSRWERVLRNTVDVWDHNVVHDITMPQTFRWSACGLIRVLVF